MVLTVGFARMVQVEVQTVTTYGNTRKGDGGKPNRECTKARKHEITAHDTEVVSIWRSDLGSVFATCRAKSSGLPR